VESLNTYPTQFVPKSTIQMLINKRGYTASILSNIMSLV